MQNFLRLFTYYVEINCCLKMIIETKTAPCIGQNDKVYN